jgi:hypothetical protein
MFVEILHSVQFAYKLKQMKTNKYIRQATLKVRKQQQYWLQLFITHRIAAWCAEVTAPIFVLVFVKVISPSEACTSHFLFSLV